MGCCSSAARPLQSGVLADSAAQASSVPQLLFLGLDGAGKTTLFYKTLIPGWMNIEAAMEPTKAFHYEVFQRGKLKVGMWDLSGHPALRRSWPAFYRYVQVWGVVFVVSVTDVSAARVSAAKSLLSVLLADACLKSACIVVIFNTMGTPADTAPLPPVELAGRLGLHQAAAEEGSRLRWFVVNCRDGEADPEWAAAFRFILERFQHKLAPPPPQHAKARAARGN
ncbi:hypothetical protein Efla_000433 [Eimeria flavescens]